MSSKRPHVSTKPGPAECSERSCHNGSVDCPYHAFVKVINPYPVICLDNAHMRLGYLFSSVITNTPSYVHTARACRQSDITLPTANDLQENRIDPLCNKREQRPQCVPLYYDLKTRTCVHHTRDNTNATNKRNNHIKQTPGTNLKTNNLV